MNDLKYKEDAATAWTWVGAWILFLYTMIPLARNVQEYIRDHGGKVIFLWVTYIAFGLGALTVVRFVRNKQVVLSPIRSILLALIFGLFSYLTWTLRANPEEALHFVEYGVLSLLVFRALRHHISDGSIFACAAMIGAFFGIVDEIIQWITPRRFFDFRDIGINVIAVFLIQCALAFGIRPVSIQGPIGRFGKKLSFIILAVNLAVILLCFSNTPQFIDYVHEKTDGAAWLRRPMAEYGYMHEDPEIGWFKSRLTLEEIKKQDEERYQEVITALHVSVSLKRYKRFVQRRPAHKDPITVESRVHLFRRDRYAGRFNDPEDQSDKRHNATVAWYENRIMERYFPHILTHSKYFWSPLKRDNIEKNAAMTRDYHSAVSKALITRFSQKSLTITLCLLIALSITGAVFTGRKRAS